MSSFPTRNRISTLPTSNLALAALRNGRPRMSSTSRSPSIHYHEVGKDKGISYSHQDVFDYPFGIWNSRIYKLHSLVCWEKNRVLKFFINYRGHDVDARPQIAKAMLIVFFIDLAAVHGDPCILLHCYLCLPPSLLRDTLSSRVVGRDRLLWNSMVQVSVFTAKPAQGYP